jgi:hypothetical protein
MKTPCEGFKGWLTNRYYRETGVAPGAQAVQAALATLQGIARFDQPKQSASVRVA